MNTQKTSTEVLLWTALVLILSYLCYFPMFLEKKGVPMSQVVLGLKYLFVSIPLIVSVCFSLKQRYLKKWFSVLFAKKIELKAIVSCIILGGIGLSFAALYCLIAEEKDLFINSYPTPLAVVVNCSYLFVTAMIEEIAWRGFLLHKITTVKGKQIAFIYVGIVWAIWHIPMWTIRNSLEVKEIILYFMWTILVSFLLGINFYTYRNILIVALSHMFFNTCFIMPVKYNVILLGCIVGFLIFYFKIVMLKSEEK